jgi:hypothetical protein
MADEADRYDGKGLKYRSIIAWATVFWSDPELWMDRSGFCILERKEKRALMRGDLYFP